MGIARFAGSTHPTDGLRTDLIWVGESASAGSAPALPKCADRPQTVNRVRQFGTGGAVTYGNYTRIAAHWRRIAATSLTRRRFATCVLPPDAPEFIVAPRVPPW